MCLARVILVVSALALVTAVDHPESNEADHGIAGCDCMEYWGCVMSGGTPYSYCGLSESSVCCFVPPGAKPVGLFPPTPGTATTKGRCGHKGADSGRDGYAEPAEWPWHAAILEKPDDLYVCGASLLDESWVLTAAHCVDDYVADKGNNLKVRLGEYDVTSTREALRHEEYDVAGVVLYPGFNNATLAHDIALLRLRHPAKKRPHIDIVCLPKQGSSFPETGRGQNRINCVITGWGRRSEVSEHSVVLKEVTVPLWQNSVCEAALRQQFGPSYSLPDTSICAGAEGRDACDGDGGGPLVCEQGGQWYQVGVISFGIGCGRRNTPGVYTRVNMYEQWITDTVLRYRNRHQR
ncbi:chymotrypsin-like protease CTRL-1 [Anabrus simplex]|uniref:chymotrypsin-like protease CTRL-1 n=1 Tax=Anabrus simplex TaxID=316456 RepID=UPI0034DD36BD